MNLMKKWLKPDPDEAVTASELDAMAQEASLDADATVAIEGDDETANDTTEAIDVEDDAANAIPLAPIEDWVEANTEAIVDRLEHDQYAADNAIIASHARVPHALDDAPNGSKIVRTLEGAMLATPHGVTLLPPGDPAHKLPEGARISKFEHADGVRYQSVQLGAAGYEPVWDDSASTAIEMFVARFHLGR